jgi:hypothetical protein
MIDVTAPARTKGLAQLVDALERFQLVPRYKVGRFDFGELDGGWAIGFDRTLATDEYRIEWNRLIVYMPDDTSVWEQAVGLYADRSAQGWLRRHVLVLASDLGLPLAPFRRPA